MAPLLWIDVAGLTLCAFGSASLALMVLGLGSGRAVNRLFALFGAANAAWVSATLLLRISLWAGLWQAQLLLEIATLALCLTGPALLAFAARYTHARSPVHDVLAFAALAATVALAVPLFSHHLIHHARLLANGTTVAVVSTGGYLAAVVPLAPMIVALGLFWRHRRVTGERLVAASVTTFVAGFLGGGVAQLPFPVLSLTNSASVLLLGYAIVRGQLMNPLRELTDDLERKVAERSAQLERAYQEVEQRVEERTAQLQREVAERRNTEEVLRESEEKFRNLADESPNMIFINSFGRVVYANRKCEELMGYSREQFYAPDFDFVALLAPECVSGVKAAYSRHLIGEEVPPYEYALQTRDGRRIEVLITSKLIRYGGEQAILGIITDIRTRKRMERLLEGLNEVALAATRALTAEEAFGHVTSRLGALGLFSAVYSLSEDGRTLSLARYSGDDSVSPFFVPSPELGVDEGSPQRQVLDERHGVVVLAARMPQVAPGRLARLLLAPLVVDGSAIGILAAASAELSEEDLPTITAYANMVGAAARKIRLMRELEQSVEQLRRAQIQLVQSQKMEAIGRLAGGLAHDFNNVLTAITGYTDLLLASDRADPDFRDDLNEIRQAAARASALTRQLLAFSRKQVLQPRVLDINAVISGLKRMLRRLIPEDIDVGTELAEGLGSVKADRGQIEQVILNLAVNGRDAMAQGGRLSIETANVELDQGDVHLFPDVRPGSYVMLAVTDTGVGMDPETQQHLFEPFFTTKAPGTGTGLGLSTVYGIVTQSGGHIVVQSEKGRGSSFRIYLPRLASTPAERGTEAPSGESASGSETVLVVEDEAVLRDLVRRVLVRSGYQVLAAANAEEAIRASDSHPGTIHLMVTDVIMPGSMNGRELALALAPRRPGMRVLFMSGYAENTIVHDGALDPGVSFLAKPFSPSTLTDRVRRVLGGPSPA